MKMKVLFDANPLVNGPMSGVGYYTQGLIRSLTETFPEDLELVGHYFNFLGRKTNLRALPQAPNVSYVESKLLPGKIISICRRLGFQPPIELFVRKQFDVMLYTNFVCLPSLRRTPVVTAVHDLCFYDVPEYVNAPNRNFLLRFVPRSIKRADLVITISEYTKQRLKEVYGLTDDKVLITPIPPAVPKSAASLIGKLNVRKKYILYVGTLEPRKNIRGLAVAYTKLPQSIRGKYSLVLAGGTGWYIEEDLKYIQDLIAQGYDILLPGYVSNEQKAALYSHASLFVLASFYEGFGMPILEAMSYGCPCALSDIDVFHEVAGDAAVYFNHQSSDAIADKLAEILDDTSARKKLIAKSSKRLELYDWEIVAKEVYESLKAIKNG